MNIVVEKQPKCVATLRVEIPADTVNGQRDQIVGGYASKAKLPGFRPGKAPRKVVEKRFEKEISDELNERLFHQAFDEATTKESLNVINYGMPQKVKTKDDGSMSFISILTLAPEFELPEYKGLKVTIPKADVPEEEIENQLKSLQERFADFTDIEGRAAKKGDYAVVDYSSTVGGKPTEEVIGKSAGYIAGREGFWVKIDDKSFLPGFADELVGTKAGDEKDITLTLPEDFPVADLQKKEIVFKTSVKELKEAKLPELNDELAEKLAPGKKLDEIKEIIKENMLNERKRRIEDMKINQLVAQFNEKVDFELPEELVTQETQSQADQMVQRGMQSGMTEEEVASQQAEIFASAGNQAANNLRTNFILQEIAHKEEITATDQELINHLAQLAEQRKQAPKKFIKEMQRSGRLPSVRNSIVIGKAIDFVVKHAEIEESDDATLPEQ